MVEGDNVFKEAITFLKSLKPLQPLEWDQNLYSSAEEHVNDIGPKGLLLYQSSDGTEPEDRINKYCNYETNEKMDACRHLDLRLKCFYSVYVERRPPNEGSKGWCRPCGLW